MKLEEYLRNDFCNNLKPLIIKDKCEVCGTDAALHLHHVYDFASYLKRCLNFLNLDYREDISNYSPKELKQIRDYMISAQLRGKYKTLCRECHKQEHIIKGKVIFNKQQVIDKEKKVKERELYNQNVLKPYLDSIVGKKLFKEDQKCLIDMIGLKDKQGRKQKAISLLNSYLIENYSMTLNSSRMRNEERKQITIWILETINN